MVVTHTLTGRVGYAQFTLPHSIIHTPRIHPSPPHPQPLIVADFDGDGLTDILAVSHEGVYAYAQILHPGALPFR